MLLDKNTIISKWPQTYPGRHTKAIKKKLYMYQVGRLMHYPTKLVMHLNKRCKQCSSRRYACNPGCKNRSFYLKLKDWV